MQSPPVILPSRDPITADRDTRARLSVLLWPIVATDLKRFEVPTDMESYWDGIYSDPVYFLPASYLESFHRLHYGSIDDGPRAHRMWSIVPLSCHCITVNFLHRLQVGGGPAGLIMALTLALNDIKFRIIDKDVDFHTGSRGFGIQVCPTRPSRSTTESFSSVIRASAHNSRKTYHETHHPFTS